MKTVDEWTKGIKKETLSLYEVPNNSEIKKINKILYCNKDVTILHGDQPLKLNAIDNMDYMNSNSQPITDTPSSDPFIPLESERGHSWSSTLIVPSNRGLSSDGIISESSEPEVLESEITDNQ